jgi:hypothetical protein
MTSAGHQTTPPHTHRAREQTISQPQTCRKEVKTPKEERSHHTENTINDTKTVHFIPKEHFRDKLSGSSLRLES